MIHRYTVVPSQLGLALLCACLLASIVAGCAVEPASQRVRNASSHVLDGYTVQQDGSERQRFGGLQPGYFYPLNSAGDKCIDLVVIARIAGTRTEFARRSGPFCPDDEWVISDP